MSDQWIREQMSDDERRRFDLGTAFVRIWEDQLAFNTLFRQPPANVEEMTKQVRDFVLYTESELHELLRVFRWKEHRRDATKVNLAHATDELADILKFTTSLYQICGKTPETMIDAYWAKTAVVRQRYQEEWASKVTGPCAVVDIDQVLCDYISGICDWLIAGEPWTRAISRIQKLKKERTWINGAALGMDEGDWQKQKHEFRISGAKRDLPVFPDAKPFLDRLRERGYQIVLLTSRPIDRYPNMHTDTLLWLQKHQLPFDFLWWSFDKTERVLDSAIRDQVNLVVDDDERHLAGFVKLGIPCFLLRREPKAVFVESEQVELIRTLDQLTERL